MASHLRLDLDTLSPRLYCEQCRFEGLGRSPHSAATLAQSVEHSFRKAGVLGSSPRGGLKTQLEASWRFATCTLTCYNSLILMLQTVELPKDLKQ